MVHTPNLTITIKTGCTVWHVFAILHDTQSSPNMTWKFNSVVDEVIDILFYGNVSLRRVDQVWFRNDNPICKSENSLSKLNISFMWEENTQ